MSEKRRLAEGTGWARWSWLWTALLLLAAGGFSVLYTVKETDHGLRAQLLQNANSVAQSIDRERVKALAGSAADLSSPDYLRLREQLSSVRSANAQCRFVYLMGRPTGSKPLFLVDSEPPDSRDYSAPGQVYEESSAELLRAFDTKAMLVEGPVADRWGTWTSALVSLTDPDSGAVIAVLGMDVDARAWKRTVLTAAALPAGGTLTVLALLGLSTALARSRRRILAHHEALQATERCFHSLCESVTDIIVVATPDGRILHTNEAARRRLGYSAAEMAAMHLLDWHPAELRTEAETILAAVLEGKQDTCPLPLLAKGGTLVPVRTHIWRGKWGSEDSIFAISRIQSPAQEVLQVLGATFHRNPSPMALSSIDDRRLVDVNDAFLAVTGYARDEVVGRTADELGLFADPAGNRAAVERLRARQRVTNLEFRVRRKDGAFLDGLFSGEVVASQGREFFLTVMLDITERKLAEERSSAFARCLLEFGSDARANIDRLVALCGEMLEGACALYNRLDGGILCSVGQWQAPPGFQPECCPDGHICYDVIRANADEPTVVRDLQHSDYAHSDPNVAAYGLQTYIGVAVRCRGQAVGSLCVVYRQDVQPVGQHLSFLRLAGFAVAVEEERGRAAEALRESEEMHRALLEGSTHGILAASTQTRRFLYANPSLCRMYGYPPDELLSLAVDDLHPSAARDHVMAEFGALSRGEKHTAACVPCRRKDGTIFLADISAALVNLKGTEYAVGFFTDITERKRTEAELSRLTETERLIAIASAELVGTPPERTDAAIECALATIGSFVGADRAYVFLFRDDGTRMDNTHEWCTTGIEAQRDRLQDVPCAALTWWMEPLRAGKAIHIPAVAALPAAASREKADLQRQGIRSLLAVPMAAGDELMGFIGLDAVRTDRAWTNPEQDALRLLGSVVIHAILRGRAEKRLGESAEKFRTLADNIPGVVYLCRNDARYTMLYLNDAVARLTGYPCAEFLDGRVSFVDLYHPDDAAAIFREVNQALEKRQAFHLIYRLRRRDGEWRWVEEWGTGVFANDTLRFLEGFLADITARKQMEAEHERLSAAIAQVAECVVITGLDGTIQYVNPAFTAVTGYSSAEVLGQNPRLLNSGAHDAAFYRELWATITGGRTWEGRFVNRRKNGTPYTEEATVSPVRDAAGRIAHYVAVKRDISEHLRLSAQLQQAQKMESIGRLAGGVAHDFNNLLTVIIAHSDLALQAIPEDAALRGDIVSVLEAAQRATGLTRQLLAFARRQVVEPRLVDLNDLTNETERMLRRLVGENIHLVRETTADLGHVRADPSQIEQVLLNLVVNARDAMPGGGTLTLRTATVTLDEDYARQHLGVTPGPYVVLSVSDTGVGMSDEVKQHLFEPFFTTKPQGEGTGLGLPTCLGIVQQSKGHIRVDSEVGRGTTVSVHLPCVSEPATRVAGRNPAAAAMRGTETILLVEDDAPLRGVMARVLRMHGYTVLDAGHGRDGLALAQIHGAGIRLLITDVVMPEMGGDVLALEVRPHCPQAAILFVSGYTSDTQVREAITRPGVHFLQKPFGPNELAAKVRTVLDTP
jgi:PAS domain S-box-containing protein